MKKRKMIVNDEMIDHIHRIGSLLKVGYPLDVSLAFVTQYASDNWGEKIKRIMHSLKEGYTVHQSFDIEGIPKSTILFLYFYEKQGKLAKGFLEASHYLRQQLKWKNELIKLITYPVFLLIFSGLLLSMLYAFVLPNFSAMMTTTSTHFTYTFIEYINVAPLFLLICFVCSILMFLVYASRLKTLSPIERITHFIKYPLIGRTLRIVITYFFSLQLGRMLSAGMTIQLALQQIEEQPYVAFLQVEGKRLLDGLRSGFPLAELVKESHLYEKEFSAVIANGLRTGYIATDLLHYSHILYTELERIIQKWLRRIQPIMFMVVGVIVLLLFIATLLPVYEMMNIM
ncbi:competence type IV pilus assembly protein ComGB [Bacillus sp. JCM 19034]|uniref:competence type IV pilus assembly protein ComGB n=1 Tax=Bacillus sp. JCM 19034 TaxID=1481928 RepID=UPI0007847E53|nr:competence type IV pilus assembly protein ComGB [Bacillus sp. JCM 19034]